MEQNEIIASVRKESGIRVPQRRQVAQKLWPRLVKKSLSLRLGYGVAAKNLRQKILSNSRFGWISIWTTGPRSMIFVLMF